MPIAIVDYINRDTNFSATENFSINSGSAAGRLVLYKGLSDSTTINNVLINGVAAAQLRLVTNAQGRQSCLYGGLIAGSGVISVVPAWNAVGGNKVSQVLSMSGVSSIRGVIAAANAGGFANTMTAAVNSAVGDTVLCIGSDGRVGGTFTPTAPAAAFSVGAFNSGAFPGMAATVSGAVGSVSIAGSFSGGSFWEAFMLSLIPLPDGPPPQQPSITSTPLQNNGGFLVSAALVGAYVRVSDMVPITTDAAGRIKISNAALVPGVDYVLVTAELTNPKTGAEKITAVP